MPIRSAEDVAETTVRPAVAPTAVAGLHRVVERMAWRAASTAFLPTPSVPSPTVFDGPAPELAIRTRACPGCGSAATPLPPAGAVRLVDVADAGPDVPVLTMLGCESLEPRILLPVVLVTRAAGAPPRAGYVTRAAWRAVRVGDPTDLDDERMLAGILWRLNMAETWLDPMLRAENGYPPRPMISRVRTTTAPLPLPAAGRLRTDLDAGAVTDVHDVLRPRLLGPHTTGRAYDRLDGIYRAALARVSSTLLARRGDGRASTEPR